MSRKVISIITSEYSPEFTPEAQRMEAIAKKLSDSFDVHVFTLTKSRYSLIAKAGDGLTIHYLPRNLFRKRILPNFLRRVFNAFRLVRQSKTIDADLNIVSSSNEFLLPAAGAGLKSRLKIADVAHLAGTDLRNSNGNYLFARRRVLKLVQSAMSKFDSLTVSTENEKLWLIKKTRCENDKVHIISNGVTKEKFQKLSKMKHNPARGKFTIACIGHIHSTRNFFALIEAVRGMSDTSLHLVGDGVGLDRLKHYVNKNRISNVYLHGWLPWKQASDFYQSSNLLFASLKEEVNTPIPTKLYEYLATGLPILFQGGGCASAFLRNFTNTFVIEDDDSKKLERLIWRIRRMEPERSQRNIKITGSFFIRENLCIRYAELVASLLNERALSTTCVEDVLERTSS